MYFLMPAKVNSPAAAPAAVEPWLVDAAAAALPAAEAAAALPPAAAAAAAVPPEQQYCKRCLIRFYLIIQSMFNNN